MKLLHNPRCSKSRQALQWLTEQGISPEVVDYQKTPLTRDALQALAKQLNLGSLNIKTFIIPPFQVAYFCLKSIVIVV